LPDRPHDDEDAHTKPTELPATETGSPLPAEETATRTGHGVTWDATNCTSDDYNLIYGTLADVASRTIQGAECAMGLSGSHAWTGVPAGDLYFLVVGVDDTGVYEGSWGQDSTGDERNATAPSNFCDATNKVVTGTCS